MTSSDLRSGILMLVFGWLYVGLVGPFAWAVAWFGLECYSGVCPGPNGPENAAILMNFVGWAGLPALVGAGLWFRSRWTFAVAASLGIAGAAEIALAPIGSSAFAFWFLTIPGTLLIAFGGVKAARVCGTPWAVFGFDTRIAAGYIVAGAAWFAVVLDVLLFGPDVKTFCIFAAAIGLLFVARNLARDTGHPGS